MPAPNLLLFKHISNWGMWKVSIVWKRVYIWDYDEYMGNSGCGVSLGLRNAF